MMEIDDQNMQNKTTNQLDKQPKGKYRLTEKLECLEGVGKFSELPEYELLNKNMTCLFKTVK